MESDVNLLGVVEYAVEELQIQHIIVCGHYDCSGVKNAMSRKDLGPLNPWLRHLKDLYGRNRREMETIESEQTRRDRLVELNVSEQIQNLAATAVVKKAWDVRQSPVLHGWVYDLRSGYLKEIACVRPGAKLDEVHSFEVG